MIIDPDFLDHWKTRMLVGLLDGDEQAPLYLIRLWSHCQNRRQATFQDLSAEALRSLCRFPGHANKLESSLVTSGFVRRDGKSLEICGWAEKNKALLSSWGNGSKGSNSKSAKIPSYKVADSTMTSTQWYHLKDEVIKRDGLRCRYCGTELEDALIDHIVPASRGGGNELDNLCVCCRQCNTSKKNLTLEEWDRSRGSARGSTQPSTLLYSTLLSSSSTSIEIDKLEEVTKSKKKKFIKPSLEEVTAYCRERKNNIDPQEFIDRYEANGWVVGRNKTPMKCWMATVRNWERMSFPNQGSQPQPTPEPIKYLT